jgi:hypothetical protein
VLRSPGEVTGNGDNTPIGAARDNDLHAHSICSFSELNDEYYRDGDTSAPRAQHPAPRDLHGSERLPGITVNRTR